MKSIIILALAALLTFVLAVVSNQFKHIKLSSWLLVATLILVGVIFDRIYILLVW